MGISSGKFVFLSGRRVAGRSILFHNRETHLGCLPSSLPLRASSVVSKAVPTPKVIRDTVLSLSTTGTKRQMAERVVRWLEFTRPGFSLNLLQAFWETKLTALCEINQHSLAWYLHEKLRAGLDGSNAIVGRAKSEKIKSREIPPTISCYPAISGSPLDGRVGIGSGTAAVERGQQEILDVLTEVHGR